MKVKCLTDEYLHAHQNEIYKVAEELLEGYRLQTNSPGQNKNFIYSKNNFIIIDETPELTKLIGDLYE